MRSLVYKLENRLKYNKLAQKVFFWLKLRRDFPIALNIEPTNHCNLFCYFCPQGMGKVVRPKGFMNMRLYKKIINELKSKPKLWQLFLNKDGEPFLHPQIDKMVSLAKEAKVAHRVEIFTNGLVLTERVAKDLIEAELDILHISLDAFSKKTFKKMKGRDCLLEIEKNILKLMALKKQLKKRLPVVEVKMTVTDLNKKEKKHFLKYWKDKVDQVKIYPLHEWTLPATSDQRPATRYACVVPFYNPAVNWDGEVTSCCVNYKSNELILGNVDKQSLQEIWDGRKYRKLRKDLLASNLKDWPTCAGCTYWRLFPRGVIK